MSAPYKYIQVRAMGGGEVIVNTDDSEDGITFPMPGDLEGDAIYMLIGTFKDVSKVHTTLRYVPEEDED